MNFKSFRRSLREAIRKIRLGCFNKFSQISFSQECEDLLLLNLIGKSKSGFYVDVGGFDPIRFSNTYLFYKRGWNGIIIEPNPDAESRFRRIRKRDIFVPEGIALNASELDFYRFKEPALNTFNKELAVVREKIDGREIIDIITRRLSPLSFILDRYSNGTEIDILSVDAEGMDFEVLKSNNWKKYRPRFLVVEINLAHEEQGYITELYKNPTCMYLVKQGYNAVIKTGRSVIFKKSR